MSPDEHDTSAQHPSTLDRVLDPIVFAVLALLLAAGSMLSALVGLGTDSSTFNPLPADGGVALSSRIVSFGFDLAGMAPLVAIAALVVGDTRTRRWALLAIGIWAIARLLVAVDTQLALGSIS